MRKIYKYALDGKKIDAIQWVPMPSGASILDVQFQGTDLTIWAEVDPDSPPLNHQFYVAFTGSDAPPKGWKYLRTLQKQGFVFHIYTTDRTV